MLSKKNDLIVQVFGRFGFGYGSQPFYALVHVKLLLVDADYARVLSLGCHPQKIRVVREYYRMVCVGDFDLLLVDQA